MRRFFFALALSVTGISNLLKILLGLILHGFTTYLAYKVSGFFWAARGGLDNSDGRISGFSA